MTIKFRWDKSKAESNLRKHKVSFDIATRVFLDPFALMKQDRIEKGERRWQTIGVADTQLLLLVAHTVHDDDGCEIIRIISARKANQKERKQYEQNC